MEAEKGLEDFCKQTTTCIGIKRPAFSWAAKAVQVEKECLIQKKTAIVVK